MKKKKTTQNNHKKRKLHKITTQKNHVQLLQLISKTIIAREKKRQRPSHKNITTVFVMIVRCYEIFTIITFLGIIGVIVFTIWFRVNVVLDSYAKLLGIGWNY